MTKMSMVRKKTFGFIWFGIKKVNLNRLASLQINVPMFDLSGFFKKTLHEYVDIDH